MHRPPRTCPRRAPTRGPADSEVVLIAFDVRSDNGARLRAHARADGDPRADTLRDTAAGLERLCAAVAEELQMVAATVSLRARGGAEAVAATSHASFPQPGSRMTARGEDLEFELGEGPGLEAFTLGRPVLEPDLGRAQQRRWPAYAPAAMAAGACAVFAFPLQLGASRFGTLVLYADRVRHLSAEEVAECLIFAEIATDLLLDGQDWANRGVHDDGLDRALDLRTVVYQAQGVVMVDLGISLADALVRLRAHAYAAERPLADVAADVVAGRLSLATDRTEPGTTPSPPTPPDPEE